MSISQNPPRLSQPPHPFFAHFSSGGAFFIGYYFGSLSSGGVPNLHPSSKIGASQCSLGNASSALSIICFDGPSHPITNARICCKNIYISSYCSEVKKSALKISGMSWSRNFSQRDRRVWGRRECECATPIMNARVANSSSKMKLRVETQFAMWLMWITTLRKLLFLELHGSFGYGYCRRLVAIESVAVR
jgi:hypothetical protein